MEGFVAKENPLCGRRGPFSSMVISNITASPPLILLSIGNSAPAPILTSGIFVSSTGWYVGLQATGDLREGAHRPSQGRQHLSQRPHEGWRARGILGVVQKRRQQNAVGLFC